MAFKDSLHSLYPQCEIKSYQSVLSLQHEIPDVKLEKELASSYVSLQETKSSKYCLGRSLSQLEKIMVKEDREDMFEPELIRLNDSCDGSDSGYSGQSPDGSCSRDSKSPSCENTIRDRKSPFSDMSDDLSDIFEEKNGITSELLPDVIVVNETKQQTKFIPKLPRNYCRQQSRFQNPKKDILISQKSQDNLAVVDQDELEGPATHLRKKNNPNVHFLENTTPDVYCRREPGTVEYIPPRSVAKPKGEHGDMNKGCYYLMAVLDFFWCL